MPLKTERIKMKVSDQAELEKASAEVKKLLEFCAVKKGSMIVDKSDSETLEIGCMYYDEEPIKFQTEEGAFKVESQPLAMPPRVDEISVDEAKSRVDNVVKFIKECAAKGGKIQLTRGTDQEGSSYVDIECITPEEEKKEG